MEQQVMQLVYLHTFTEESVKYQQTLKWTYCQGRDVVARMWAHCCEEADSQTSPLKRSFFNTSRLTWPEFTVFLSRQWVLQQIMYHTKSDYFTFALKNKWHWDHSWLALFGVWCWQSSPQMSVCYVFRLDWGICLEEGTKTSVNLNVTFAIFCG